MVKLHLGCNTKKIPGFINVDVVETSATDLVFDLVEINKYIDPTSVDYIYTCHTLEHLSRHNYFQTLSDLYLILKPNGMLRISVPDFEAIARYYVTTGDLNEIRGTLFGGQINEYDYHCWTWDFKSLSEDLNKIGFTNIKRYDPFKTEHSGIRDWSRDFIPRHDKFGKRLPDEEWYRGTLVSLNIEAIKPKDNK